MHFSDHEESISPEDKSVCGADSESHPYYSNVVKELLSNLSLSAPMNSRFAVATVSVTDTPAFGLAQCWDYLNQTACGGCLVDGASEIKEVWTSYWLGVACTDKALDFLGGKAF